MKYKVVLTHNPQEYFEDLEPEELTIIKWFDERSLFQNFNWILDKIKNGYKAIIILQEGDNTV